MTVALEKFLRPLVLGCLFAVPFVVLVVAEQLFFPYITGKAFVFRLLVEAAFGGWLLLLLLGKVPRPRASLIQLTIGIFIAVVAIADFTGVAPFKSFWSNFERMEGLVTLLHAFAYFMVAGSMFTERLWERFWQVSLGVSAWVGLGALGELAEGATRIAGTTGNPIYLAVYTLFHIFIALFLAYRSKSILTYWLYGATVVLNLAVLWFTGTRGTILGLAAGALVVALGVLIFGRTSVNKWLYRGAVALITVVVLAAATFIAFRTSDTVQNHPTLARFANISMAFDEKARDTSALRIMVWGSAWEGFKERPLLGWGQENFNYVFNKYYNPNMYWAEPWYDRTHNIMLDWLIAAGVLGLLAYLGMYLALFIEIIRTRTFDLFETSLLSGLLVGYGVHNLFVFDNLLSYILFFSLAAWIYSSTQDKESGNSIQISKTLQLLVLVIVSLGTIFTVYLINYPLYAQNKALLGAIGATGSPETINQSRELFEQATAYHTGGTQESREQFGVIASRIAEMESVPLEDKELFVNSALFELQKQEQAYPDDARFPYLIASLLSAYNADVEAEQYLKRALELSPNKPTFIVSLGINAIKRGDFVTAEKYLTQALVLVSEYERALELLDVVRAEQEK